MVADINAKKQIDDLEEEVAALKRAGCVDPKTIEEIKTRIFQCAQHQKQIIADLNAIAYGDERKQSKQYGALEACHKAAKIFIAFLAGTNVAQRDGMISFNPLALSNAFTSAGVWLKNYGSLPGQAKQVDTEPKTTEDDGLAAETKDLPKPETKKTPAPRAKDKPKNARDIATEDSIRRIREAGRRAPWSNTQQSTKGEIDAVAD